MASASRIWTADDPLLPSGILGPVHLVAMKEGTGEAADVGSGAGDFPLHETFDYPEGTPLTEAGADWVRVDGSPRNAPVADGKAHLRKAGKLVLPLPESFSLDPSESDAGSRVDALWFRMRARIPGDVDSAYFRPGRLDRSGHDDRRFVCRQSDH